MLEESSKGTVVVVDDEIFNLEILVEYLSEAGYHPESFSSAEDAWDYIERGCPADVMVLDRMMPKVSGMDLLLRMKESNKHRDIPVIFETAMASSEDMVEGIRAGAFYYLTKPFERNNLICLVDSAIRDHHFHCEIRNERSTSQSSMELLTQASFQFRTLQDAKNLACFMGSLAPSSQPVVQAVVELITNAIEHGNLGISYAEKKRLLLEGRWEDEVSRRLEQPENKGKYGLLEVHPKSDRLLIRIQDQGKGFDWEGYLDFDPNRTTDPNGRGIALSKRALLDLKYEGAGNVLTCAVPVSS